MNDLTEYSCISSPFGSWLSSYYVYIPVCNVFNSLERYLIFPPSNNKRAELTKPRISLFFLKIYGRRPGINGIVYGTLASEM